MNGTTREQMSADLATGHPVLSPSADQLALRVAGLMPPAEAAHLWSSLEAWAQRSPGFLRWRNDPQHYLADLDPMVVAAIEALLEEALAPLLWRARVHALTYEELLGLAQRFEDQVLTTTAGRRFRVGLRGSSPFFIPESTGTARGDTRTATERFIARYNATGSLRPSDYADLTRSASYYLGLLRQRE